MKKYLFLFLFIPLFSFSQKLEKIKGNKDVTIKEIKIDSFTHINIDENFKISLLEGKPLVKIEADDNLHDVINIDVDNDVLSFDFTKRITNKKKLNITVYYPTIVNTIEVNDDAELQSLSTIVLENLNLKVNGNSKVDFDIETGYFNLSTSNKSKSELIVIADSSNVSMKESSRLKGTIKSPKTSFKMFDRATSNTSIESDSTNIELISRVTFSSKSLITKKCIISTNDNSKASINISDELTISAKGNSTINIYNDPKITIEEFTDTATLNKRKIK